MYNLGGFVQYRPQFMQAQPGLGQFMQHGYPMPPMQHWNPGQGLMSANPAMMQQPRLSLAHLMNLPGMRNAY